MELEPGALPVDKYCRAVGNSPSKLSISSFPVGLVSKTKAAKLKLCLHLYIDPFDSKESDGGVVHTLSNYPRLLLEMLRYCRPVEIFIFVFSFIKIFLEFKTATIAKE